MYISWPVEYTSLPTHIRQPAAAAAAVVSEDWDVILDWELS